MNRDEQLGAPLTQALHQDVAAMGIDPRAGAVRLDEALAKAQLRTRRRRRVLAATVMSVLAVVAGWAVVRGDEDLAMPATGPSQNTTAQSQPLDTSAWPYLLDLRTGGRTVVPVRLVASPDEWPQYSLIPGTRTIAMSTCDEVLNDLFGTAGCLVGGLNVIGLDEATIRPIRVPARLAVVGVEASPDGTRLLYAATNGSRIAVPEFYLYDLATDRSSRLTDIPLDTANLWHLQATFSSDGRAVLYDLPRESGTFTGWDVWSVPVDGGAAVVAVKDAKGPRAIPGTTDLAVERPKEGVRDAAAIQIVSASGARRTLVEARSGIASIYAAPDGRRLAYHDAQGAFVVDIATGRTTRVADGSPGAWIDAHTLLILP